MNPALPTGPGPTCGATNKIDAAVALRIGERGHNLTFKVIGLIGKAAEMVNATSRLTSQCPRIRKTVLNLKDQEARLLEVIARHPLGWVAVVAVFQFEYVRRKHQHRRVRWACTGRRHKAVAVQDVSICWLVYMSKCLLIHQRRLHVIRAIDRETEPVAQKQRRSTDG